MENTPRYIEVHDALEIFERYTSLDADTEGELLTSLLDNSISFVLEDEQ